MISWPQKSRWLFSFIFLIFGACTFRNQVESKNTLNLVAHERIKGLDPIYAEDLYSGLQVGQVYEALLQYHYLKRPYVLVPNLAEAMPEVSPDGLSYRFHLKKGVLFQDDPAFQASQGKGRELIADDVVYSFKRLADPKLNSPGWWIFDGKIVGLDSWRKKASQSAATSYSAEVEGLKALNRYTIQIKLTQRSAQFPYFLAMNFTGIVPHEGVDFYGKDFIRHPVGTGPFRLEEYNPSSKIVWVRNPTYRQDLYPSEGAPGDREAGLLEDAGKPLPLVDRIVTHVLIEQQPMWLNFMAGKLDFSGIPKDNYSSALGDGHELSPELKRKGIQLFKTPAYDVTHATFNLTDPLLGKNKSLRQALSLAYDGASFIRLFYNGRAIPAQGPIPPGLHGYDEEALSGYRKFDLARAKLLLAKAGYSDGRNLPPLEYATLANSTGRQAAEFMEKMMAQLGVKLHISAYSWPQFLEVVKQGKAQIWEYAWGADYPDAENFLQLFYGKNVSPGPNDSRYVNPEFDRLYEKALTLPNPEERSDLYKKMARLLAEDVPWIFIAHRMNYVLTQPWLKNYKPNDFDRIRYKYYRIDDSKRR